jgi:RNA polymerase sigma-70 factor (ECF subfamily)
MLRNDPFRDAPTLIRRVYAYAAYRLGDGPDAEDATSDTFERALRYRDSFDPRRGEPVAWLLGIARRCVAEALAVRPETVGEVPEIAAALDVEQEAARRLDIRAAVLRLDDRDRELLALRYGADLTARQIAELLEVKTNTVEVALHRALGRLRERLEAPTARDADDEDEETSLEPVRI